MFCGPVVSEPLRVLRFLDQPATMLNETVCLWIDQCSVTSIPGVKAPIETDGEIHFWGKDENKNEKTSLKHEECLKNPEVGCTNTRGLSRKRVRALYRSSTGGAVAKSGTSSSLGSTGQLFKVGYTLKNHIFHNNGFRSLSVVSTSLLVSIKSNCFESLGSRSPIVQSFAGFNKVACTKEQQGWTFDNSNSQP